MGSSVSSASRFAVLVGACAALAITSCGATPILKIDQEIPAIDLDACVAGVAPCVRTGAVSAFMSIEPGSARELLIPEGAAVDAPLATPAAESRFGYLAIGLLNGAKEGVTTTIEVSIVGDAATKSTITPPSGFSRVEIDMREWAPTPGARLKLRTATGTVIVTYAVGRWFDYGHCSSDVACHAGVKCAGGRCADAP